MVGPILMVELRMARGLTYRKALQSTPKTVRHSYNTCKGSSPVHTHCLEMAKVNVKYHEEVRTAQ